MKSMTIPELYDYLRSDHFMKQDGNIFYNYYIYQYPANKYGAQNETYIED